MSVKSAARFKYGRYYRESGRFSIAALIVTVVGGLVWGLTASCLYAYCMYALHDISLEVSKGRVFLSGIFGVSIGWVPARILIIGKVRCKRYSLWLILVLTIVAYYMSWAAWLQMVTDHIFDLRRTFALALNPVQICRVAVKLTDNGVWRLDGLRFSGPWLVTVWAMEAVFILYASLATANLLLGRRPFCERCGKWCDAEKLIHSSDVVETAVLRQKLDTGSFAFVANLRPPKAFGRRLMFYRQKCNTCGELVTLTVRAKTRVKDFRRVFFRRPVTVIDKLLIKKEDLQKIAPPRSQARRPIKSIG